MVPYFDPVPIEVAFGFRLARLQSCERVWADQKQAGWRGHVDRAVAVCPAFERSED
jgi:hypothetical protein